MYDKQALDGFLLVERMFIYFIVIRRVLFCFCYEVLNHVKRIPILFGMIIRGQLKCNGRASEE